VLDDAHDWHSEPGSVEEVLAAERWARAQARLRMGLGEAERGED
jgi:hypothetical protein